MSHLRSMWVRQDLAPLKAVWPPALEREVARCTKKCSRHPRTRPSGAGISPSVTERKTSQTRMRPMDCSACVLTSRRLQERASRGIVKSGPALRPRLDGPSFLTALFKTPYGHAAPWSGLKETCTKVRMLHNEIERTRRATRLPNQIRTTRQGLRCQWNGQAG